MAHETLVRRRSRGPLLKVPITALAPVQGGEIEEDHREATTVVLLIFLRDLTNEKELLRGRVSDGCQDAGTEAGLEVVRLPEQPLGLEIMEDRFATMHTHHVFPKSVE